MNVSLSLWERPAESRVRGFFNLRMILKFNPSSVAPRRLLPKGEVLIRICTSFRSECKPLPLGEAGRRPGEGFGILRMILKFNPSSVAPRRLLPKGEVLIRICTSFRSECKPLPLGEAGRRPGEGLFQLAIHLINQALIRRSATTSPKGRSERAEIQTRTSLRGSPKKQRNAIGSNIPISTQYTC